MYGHVARWNGVLHRPGRTRALRSEIRLLKEVTIWYRPAPIPNVPRRSATCGMGACLSLTPGTARTAMRLCLPHGWSFSGCASGARPGSPWRWDRDTVSRVFRARRARPAGKGRRLPPNQPTRPHLTVAKAQGKQAGTKFAATARAYPEPTICGPPVPAVDPIRLRPDPAPTLTACPARRQSYPSM